MIKSVIEEKDFEEFPALFQEIENGTIWLVDHNSGSVCNSDAFVIMVVHDTVVRRTLWNRTISPQALRDDFIKYTRPVTIQTQ